MTTIARPEGPAVDPTRRAAAHSLRKGWCPGALRPMLSGDGYVVRVRAHAGRFPLETLEALARLAGSQGNGLIDITQRASFQIRGVSEAALPRVWDGLAALGLLDDDPAGEAIRNIVVDPLAGLIEGHPDAGKLALTLERALADAIDLRRLPGKFGFAIDPSAAPVLTAVSTDIRIEGAGGGRLLIVPDGATVGVIVPPHQAVDQALALARRFLAHPTFGAGAVRRMRDLVAHAGAETLLEGFAGPIASRQAPGSPARPGLLRDGPRVAAAVLGVPFGRLDHRALQALADRAKVSGAREARVSPWRAFVIAGLGPDTLADFADLGFLTRPHDPLAFIDACPGAPACPAAEAETHGLARALAASAEATGRRLPTVHVSGCIKGCARHVAAAITLVGRAGAFDLVLNGSTTAPPTTLGLSPAHALDAALAAASAVPREA